MGANYEQAWAAITKAKGPEVARIMREKLEAKIPTLEERLTEIRRVMANLNIKLDDAPTEAEQPKPESEKEPESVERERRVRACPPNDPSYLTVEEMMRHTSMNAPREVLVDALWPTTAWGIIEGPPESGKSLYALEEALCLSFGWPVLGRFAVPKKKRVLYVASEDDRKIVTERLIDLAKVHGTTTDGLRIAESKEKVPPFRLAYLPGLDLTDSDSIRRLEIEIIQDNREIVYLDSLFHFMGLRNLKEPTSAGMLARNVTELVRLMDWVSVRIIHHSTASAGRRTRGASMGDAYGSVFFNAANRNGLAFGARGREGTWISYSGNYATPRPVCQMRPRFVPNPDLNRDVLTELSAELPGALTRGESVTSEHDKAVEAVMAILPRTPDEALPVEEIATKTGLAVQRAYRALGRIGARKTGGSKATRWYAPDSRQESHHGDEKR